MEAKSLSRGCLLGESLSQEVGVPVRKRRAIFWAPLSIFYIFVIFLFLGAEIFG